MPTDTWEPVIRKLRTGKKRGSKHLPMNHLWGSRSAQRSQPPWHTSSRNAWNHSPQRHNLWVISRVCMPVIPGFITWFLLTSKPLLFQSSELAGWSFWQKIDWWIALHFNHTICHSHLTDAFRLVVTNPWSDLPCFILAMALSTWRVLLSSREFSMRFPPDLDPTHTQLPSQPFLGTAPVYAHRSNKDRIYYY